MVLVDTRVLREATVAVKEKIAQQEQDAELAGTDTIVQSTFSRTGSLILGSFRNDVAQSYFPRTDVAPA